VRCHGLRDIRSLHYRHHDIVNVWKCYKAAWQADTYAMVFSHLNSVLVALGKGNSIRGCNALPACLVGWEKIGAVSPAQVISDSPGQCLWSVTDAPSRMIEDKTHRTALVDDLDVDEGICAHRQVVLYDWRTAAPERKRRSPPRRTAAVDS